MKFNIDCVRDVLLFLEKASYQEEMPLGKIVSALQSDYSYDEICYAIIKLDEADYISASIKKTVTGTTIVSVSDITFDGHQFLANIQTNKVWTATKNVMASIGSTSVQAAAQIATGIITSLIQKQIGLP